jgi:haloacetate dehalogenase
MIAEGSELRYASVNDIRIAYETVGSGFPLLLLHGFPRTHQVWGKVAPALSRRFTLVAPDRRGYGDSDKPADPDGYTAEIMTNDAYELMRELGHEHYMVVGHDKGAPTARRLAAENPDHVRGVVIIDAGPEGGNRPQRQDPTGRQWYFDFFRQRGVAEPLIGQNPGLFFSLFLDRNPHLTKEEHDHYIGMFSRPGVVDAILADYRSTLERDLSYWSDRLAAHGKMTTPVCAIWSSRGAEGDASMLAQWHEVAEDARGGPIADTAHYVQEQQPEATVDNIMRFADELGVP